ncbi:MAG TPA: competence/damage-inducible protein A [bacterium]
MVHAAGQGPTAGMVVIGNEILSGKITDTNSPFLCRELHFLGIRLERLFTIPDDFALIGQVVREFSGEFTWVFTSGGIGPTHDDLTIPSIAAGFGVPVVRHPVLERTIRQHYAERLTEDHLLMAQVPEGAELIDIEGLYYPQVQFRNVFIFPGVPQLFEYKFNAIKGRFRSQPIILREIFMKADEGIIAASLRETAERFADVLIGSYPSFFKRDYSVKVTLEGREPANVEAALAHLNARLGDLPVTIVRVT